eukprot:gene9570-12157_t
MINAKDIIDLVQKDGCQSSMKEIMGAITNIGEILGEKPLPCGLVTSVSVEEINSLQGQFPASILNKVHDLVKIIIDGSCGKDGMVDADMMMTIVKNIVASICEESDANVKYQNDIVDAPSSATDAPSSETVAPSSETVAPSSTTVAPPPSTVAPPPSTVAPPASATVAPSSPTDVSNVPDVHEDEIPEEEEMRASDSDHNFDKYDAHRVQIMDEDKEKFFRNLRDDLVRGIDSRLDQLRIRL